MAQFSHDTPLWMELYTKKEYEKARQILQESFRTLKVHSPDKLSVANNIGLDYIKQKKYTEARDILVPTLKIMQQQGHPGTFTCTINLAWTCAKLKDLNRAESLAQEIRTSPKNIHSRTESDLLKAGEILKYVAQLRQRSLQTSPSAIRNGKSNSEPDPGRLKPFILQQTDNSIRQWPFFDVRVGGNFFSMSIDTCSSITWLRAPPKSGLNPRGHNTYAPEANLPFCDIQNGISYGDGMEVTLERVYLDSLGVGETTQGDQMIFQASSVVAKKGIGHSTLLDGILALKPRYDATSPHLTVWAKLAASLPKPVFTADLRFNGKGRYSFGEIPQEYTDVRFWDAEPKEKDFWRLPITSYMIHGNTEKINFTAIVDTACSDICLPSCIVRRYYDIVPGSYKNESGVYIFPSDQTLPDLVLYVGEESRAVRILGKFLKPQGTLGGEPFTIGRLQESSETLGPILGHPMCFAYIVVFKGVSSLSIGLLEKPVEE